MHAQLDPDSQRREMQLRVDEFVALDVRIARLCHALDLRLRSEDDLSAILERRAPGFTHVEATLAAHADAPERHAWEHREELRGLLVMRCELLTRVVQDFGNGASREIVEMAEAELLSHGFAPGAAGMTLAHRLTEPADAPVAAPPG